MRRVEFPERQKQFPLSVAAVGEIFQNYEYGHMARYWMTETRIWPAIIFLNLDPSIFQQSHLFVMIKFRSIFNTAVKGMGKTQNVLLFSFMLIGFPGLKYGRPLSTDTFRRWSSWHLWMPAFGDTCSTCIPIAEGR